jgi:hypothetical protein
MMAFDTRAPSVAANDDISDVRHWLYLWLRLRVRDALRRTIQGELYD